jgi:hypothetical protein
LYLLHNSLRITVEVSNESGRHTKKAPTLAILQAV